MDQQRPLDPNLTVADQLVLKQLLQAKGNSNVQGDSIGPDEDNKFPDSGYESQESESSGKSLVGHDDRGSVEGRAPGTFLPILYGP